MSLIFSYTDCCHAAGGRSPPASLPFRALVRVCVCFALWSDLRAGQQGLERLDSRATNSLPSTVRELFRRRFHIVCCCCETGRLPRGRLTSEARFVRRLDIAEENELPFKCAIFFSVGILLAAIYSIIRRCANRVGASEGEKQNEKDRQLRLDQEQQYGRLEGPNRLDDVVGPLPTAKSEESEEVTGDTRDDASVSESADHWNAMKPGLDEHCAAQFQALTEDVFENNLALSLVKNDNGLVDGVAQQSNLNDMPTVSSSEQSGFVLRLITSSPVVDRRSCFELTIAVPRMPMTDASAGHGVSPSAAADTTPCLSPMHLSPSPGNVVHTTGAREDHYTALNSYLRRLASAQDRKVLMSEKKFSLKERMTEMKMTKMEGEMRRQTDEENGRHVGNLLSYCSTLFVAVFSIGIYFRLNHILNAVIFQSDQDSWWCRYMNVCLNPNFVLIALACLCSALLCNIVGCLNPQVINGIILILVFRQLRLERQILATALPATLLYAVLVALVLWSRSREYAIPAKLSACCCIASCLVAALSVALSCEEDWNSGYYRVLERAVECLMM